MSQPSQEVREGCDAREHQAPPNVYLPPAAPSPVYDAYADPATAHGWQNAYDETRELPPVVDGTPRPGETSAGGDAAPESGTGSGPEPESVSGAGAGDGEERAAADPSGVEGARPGAGRHARRAPGPGSGSGTHARAQSGSGFRRPRRGVVAAGALGGVAVAALIAGFAFSGSSAGGSPSPDGRTGPAVEDSVPAGPDGVPLTTSASATDGPSPGEDSTGTEGSRVPDVGPSDGGGQADDVPSRPSGAASTTPTPTLPTPTASSSAVPGNPDTGASSDRPGRGQGGAKRPK